MNTRFLALVVLVSLLPDARASLITAHFGVDISQSYDEYTQQYVPITPVVGPGSLDINPDAAFDITRSGNTTTSTLVIDPDQYREDIRYFSPLPDRLPGSSTGQFLFFDPFTTYGLTGYTSDLASGFVEGLNFSVVFLGPYYDHGIPSDYYSFSLNITRHSAARHGDGSSGYALTGSHLIDFLKEVQQEGDTVQYQERYSGAAFIGDYPYPVGIAGRSYVDDMARIVDVSLDGVSLAAPEPSAWLLSAAALAMAGAASRRRKLVPTAVRPSSPC